MNIDTDVNIKYTQPSECAEVTMKGEAVLRSRMVNESPYTDA